jgi:hypothetical protein
MKNLLRTSLLGIVATLFITFTFIGCGKKGKEEAPAIVSASKNSFQEVTAQLNSGGNFYLYLGTEQWMKEFSNVVERLHQVARGLPDVKPENRDKIDKGFQLLNGILQRSGIQEVSGLGMSSIEKEPGMFYSRSLLHHYPEKNTGYMWSFFGKKPHPLDNLNFLPAATSFAGFSDFDIPLIAKTIEKEISQSGIPELIQAYQQLPAQFEQMTGLTWDHFLGSLGNEVGFVLTLDDSKKTPLPMGGNSMIEIPAAEVMLVFKVNDDMIFNRIDKLLESNPMVVKKDEGDLKMRTMSLPIPLPIQLRPTVAKSGNYLFIGTTDNIIQEALAVKAGKKPGLIASEGFKKLTQGFPTEGNSFAYLDKKFNQIISQVQKQALASMPNNKGDTEWLQKLLPENDGTVFYSVSSNMDFGWLKTSYGSQDPSKLLLMAPVATTGLLAGIAVPSFVRARLRSQATTVLNEARLLDAAKDQYALENNKKGDVIPSMVDLTPYLKAGTNLAVTGKDTLGGTFTLGNITTHLKVDEQTKKTVSEATGGDAFWGPYS